MADEKFFEQARETIGRKCSLLKQQSKDSPSPILPLEPIIAKNDAIVEETSDHTFLIHNYLTKLNENCKRYLDNVYGIRKHGNTLMIGNAELQFGNDLVTVKDVSYPLTKGLLELLFRKNPSEKLITHNDVVNYQKIIEDSSAHKNRYRKDESIRRIKSNKFNNFIAPMFHESRPLVKFLRQTSVSPQSRSTDKSEISLLNRKRLSSSRDVISSRKNYAPQGKKMREIPDYDSESEYSSPSTSSPTESPSSSHDVANSHKNSMPQRKKMRGIIDYDSETQYSSSSSSSPTESLPNRKRPSSSHDITSSRKNCMSRHKKMRGIPDYDSESSSSSTESQSDHRKTYINDIFKRENKSNASLVHKPVYENWDEDSQSVKKSEVSQRGSTMPNYWDCDPSELIDRYRFLMKEQRAGDFSNAGEMGILLGSLRRAGFIY